MTELPPHERKRIEQRGHELEALLGDLGQALALTRERTTDLKIIRDFPEGPDTGAFRTLLADLRSKYDQLDQTRQGLDDVTSVLRKQALNPEETLLWKELDKTAPAGGFTDLSGLRTEVRATDEAFWSSLRGLWEKQRLQIQVRPVRYEDQ